MTKGSLQTGKGLSYLLRMFSSPWAQKTGIRNGMMLQNGPFKTCLIGLDIKTQTKGKACLALKDLTETGLSLGKIARAQKIGKTLYGRE